MTDVSAYLPEPRTTVRGRAVDAATRHSLLTPEERAALDRQREEDSLQYAQAAARRRAEVNAVFTDAYQEYERQRYVMRWVNDGPNQGIHYNTFFDTPSSPPQPTETTLHERFNAAVIEADRCARRGDTLGRVAATRMANDLRRQILQQDLSTI